jgi:hypothetical protein
MATTATLLSACLGAQDQPATAGKHVRPDGSRLRLVPDTTVLLRHDAEGERVVGRAVQTFARDTLDGRSIVLQVYAIAFDDGGALVDSLWLEDPSLLPVRHRRHSAWSNLNIEYSGPMVRGSTSTRDRPAQPVDLKLSAPAYDAAAADLVVRALELGPELRVVLPIYTAGVGPGTLEVREVREAVVRTQAGVEVAAWEVAFRQSGDPSTFVFAQDTQELLEMRDSQGRALFRSTRGRPSERSRPST